MMEGLVLVAKMKEGGMKLFFLKKIIIRISVDRSQQQSKFWEGVTRVKQQGKNRERGREKNTQHKKRGGWIVVYRGGEEL